MKQVNVTVVDLKKKKNSCSMLAEYDYDYKEIES